jgi:hypothetical protein
MPRHYFLFQLWSIVSFLIESYRSYAVGLVGHAVIAAARHLISTAHVATVSSAIAAAGFAIVTWSLRPHETNARRSYFSTTVTRRRFSALSETSR